MSALILDGKKSRNAICEKLKKEINFLGISPCLVIFQVGGNSESDVYIQQKIAFGTSIGARVVLEKIDDNNQSENTLIEKIKNCNEDESVHGIIVQLPLPKEIDKEKILSAISPVKDVDGLHPENIELLFKGTPRFVPATARGIFSLLDFYNISVEGKKVVVVGRSDLVGKPVALLAQSRGALVTVCHSKTENVPSITKTVDIVIVATGKEGLVGREYISSGQVVVDVGIHSRMVNGQKLISGDVKFDEVRDVVGAITPVPGGVGPMTVASLFENLVDACTWNQKADV